MHTRLERESASENDTERLGGQIASALQTGDVIALNGELGAGKTRLVRAIVNGLDGEDAIVNSPTFVIVQHYSVRLSVYHIDAYRLADADEFLALGGEEILAGEGVCLIEWAERIAQVLPADHLSITITPTSRDARRLQFEASGPRSAAIVERLRRT
jgi:tRNA threonylcarbamoyladenosine biosynthesis protein TsaE